MSITPGPINGDGIKAKKVISDELAAEIIDLIKETARQYSQAGSYEASLQEKARALLKRIEGQ